MEQRKDDPTFYRMLRNVLADEMNGLKGKPYLALFDSAEEDRPYEYLITRMLDSLVISLADIPRYLLYPAFPTLDTGLKTKLLVECYRRSREVSYSLMQRTSCLQEVLRFFALTMEQDEKEAEKIFEVFAFFKENLEKLSLEEEAPFFLTPRPPKVTAPAGAIDTTDVILNSGWRCWSRSLGEGLLFYCYSI